MPQRSDIVQLARTFLGTPFRHQGRLKGRGVDCLGMIILMARELGVEHIDNPNYCHFPDPNLLRQGLDRYLVPKNSRTFEPGDVLLINAPISVHVAIAAEQHGYATLVHAWAPFRKVTEHRIDEDWQKRICKVYEFPGVE